MVPAGTIIDIEPNGQIRSEKYWSIPSGSDGGTVENVRRCLEEATKQHLISDVPMGLFLSGGKDSSAIAALGKQDIGCSHSDLHHHIRGSTI